MGEPKNILDGVAKNIEVKEGVDKGLEHLNTTTITSELRPLSEIQITTFSSEF